MSFLSSSQISSKKKNYLLERHQDPKDVLLDLCGGNCEIELKRISFSVCQLDNSNGLMDTIRGIENFFTFGLGDRTFESWWTHFSIILWIATTAKGSRSHQDHDKDDDDNFLEEQEARPLILELTNDGVSLSCRDLNHGELIVETHDANDFTMTDVIEFSLERVDVPYKFVSNNCKHFAFHFARNVLHDPEGHFESFCGRLESEWRRARC